MAVSTTILKNDAIMLKYDIFTSVVTFNKAVKLQNINIIQFNTCDFLNETLSIDSDTLVNIFDVIFYNIETTEELFYNLESVSDRIVTIAEVTYDNKHAEFLCDATEVDINADVIDKHENTYSLDQELDDSAIINISTEDLNKEIDFKIKEFIIPVGTQKGIELFIAGLERLAGCPTILNLSEILGIFNDADIFMQDFFVNRFRSMCIYAGLPIITTFEVINIAANKRDLDILLDFMSDRFNMTHFSNTRRLFNTFSKMLTYCWTFSFKNNGGVGIKFYISGKLSRHLLTQAQTALLKIGNTSHGKVKYNVLFRYRQTWSESGCYGLSIYYFTASKLA